MSITKQKVISRVDITWDSLIKILSKMSIYNSEWGMKSSQRASQMFVCRNMKEITSKKKFLCGIELS